MVQRVPVVQKFGMSPPDPCGECYHPITVSADGQTAICGLDVSCTPRGMFSMGDVQYYGLLLVIAVLLLLVMLANALQKE